MKPSGSPQSLSRLCPLLVSVPGLVRERPLLHTAGRCRGWGKGGRGPAPRARRLEPCAKTCSVPGSVVPRRSVPEWGQRLPKAPKLPFSCPPSLRPRNLQRPLPCPTRTQPPLRTPLCFRHPGHNRHPLNTRVRSRPWHEPMLLVLGGNRPVRLPRGQRPHPHPQHTHPGQGERFLSEKASRRRALEHSP